MQKRKSRKRVRGNGDGSVFFRSAKNRWYAQITIDGRQISRTAKSKTHAKQILVELQGQRKQEPFSDSVTPLLGDYVDQWQAEMTDKAESTKYSYHLTIENHVKPYLELYRLDEIDRSTIEKWIRMMETNQTGRPTQIRAFNVLSSAMRSACLNGLIPKNPLTGIKKPSQKNPDIQPFSEVEVSRILNYRYDNPLYAVYLLPFHCAMRQGEIFGLKWQDIDFEQRTIRIERQASEVSGKVHIGPPKWKSYRTISMTDDVHDSLLERRKNTLADGDDFVFYGRNGKLIRRSNFGNRHWRPTLEKLKIRHRGMHHARHTCITFMLNYGAPIHTVAYVAGHKKPSTTLNIYTHLMSEDSKAAAKAISGFALRSGPAADANAILKMKQA